ncbi:MAG: OmpA family protein, partial [Acidobacteriota bacterium]
RLPSEFGTDLPVLRVVFPERTFFDTARSTLRPEAQTVASIIAESLRREPPDVAMFVSGHADSRGSDAQNEALSIDRADAVARTIFALGVRNSSIWRIGFGEDMPLYSGETDADFARNRRVEFLFSAKPEAVATWLADQQFGELCQSSSEADSSACRDRLRFREDYTAEKVDRRPHKPAVVSPATTRAARFAPKRANPATFNPSPPVRAQVIPTGSTRIRIDPVNSRSNPVRVIL